MNTLGLKQYDILSSAVNQKANYIILKVRKKADKSHIFSLKLLRNNIEDENDRNYLRLRNEYEILQNLNSEPQTFLVHPNALKLENGLAFYEMQQLDGRPLGAMLQSAARPFPLAFVVEFAKQAAQALAYCHFDVISNYTPLTTGGKPKKLLFKEEQKLVEKHTIIINNLSPDSFIYTKDNRFILANFEYAIAYGADSSNVALETDADAYRAPEKWEQNGFVSILKEGDIYAFGAILYTMLLGVEPPAPFSENYGESFSADALKKSRMLLESNDTSDADFLYAIVAKCLQKEPENRFYDGKELYNAILNENSGGE
jgi:serine/threonine protein kinase